MELNLYGNRLLICAKTNSGKSELLKWMLKKELHKFNKVFVVSPTESCNKFYSDIIPSNQIFPEFSEDWLNDLIAKLKNYKQNNKKSNIKIIKETENNIISNERDLTEKEHKQEMILKKLDVKENNVVRTKRTVKTPDKLNL